MVQQRQGGVVHPEEMHLWVGQGASVEGGVVAPDRDLVAGSAFEPDLEDVHVVARADVAGGGGVDLHVVVAGDEVGQVLIACGSCLL